MDKTKDKLLKFAKGLGYKYALPIADGEFQNYYICYTESTMSLLKEKGLEIMRKMKLGSPEVITVNKKTGLPYILDRSELIPLNKRFIASGKEQHSHLKYEDYRCE